MATLETIASEIKEHRGNHEAYNDLSLDQRETIISAVQDMSIGFSKSINGLEGSLKNITIKPGGFKFKIPGLESLKNGLTNNSFVSAMGSFKDSIIGAVMAPMALVRSAFLSVKETFMKVATGFGNIVMAPFRFIKGLFTRDKEKEQQTNLLNDINENILDVKFNFDKYFDYLKNKNLDDLERERERQKKAEKVKPFARNEKTGRMGIVDSGISMYNMLLGGLTTAVGGIVTALVAEATGLDPVLRAVLLPFKTFKTWMLGIGNLFKGLTKIKLGGIGEIFGKIGGFFKSIGGAFKGIFSMLKQVKGVGTIFKSIGSVFGGLFRFMGGLLKPFSKLAKVLRANPIVGIALTVIDGVVGFFKGFMNTEGTLFDKLLGGLEGAFLGIVKGFTEAIDLLLFKIPSWLLGVLGFDGAAEALAGFSLTGMVDDLWEKIKWVFTHPIDAIMAIPDKIADFFDWYWETLKAGFSAMWDFITDIPNKIVGIAKKLNPLNWFSDDEEEEEEKKEAVMRERKSRVYEKTAFNPQGRDLSTPFGRKMAYQDRKKAQLKRNNAPRTAEEIKTANQARSAMGLPDLAVPNSGRSGVIAARSAENKELNRANAAPTVVQTVDGRATTNNNNTTVLNSSGPPSTVDGADRPYAII